MTSKNSSRVDVVPDPWRLLHEHLSDVVLLRQPIEEPGRYYDEQRAIVLRKGLSIEAERRYLWHEIVHALRRDRACAGFLGDKVERSVEREAVRRAMPHLAVRHGLERASTWHEFCWHMKVPEQWVRFRMSIAHPAERATFVQATKWEESA